MSSAYVEKPYWCTEYATPTSYQLEEIPELLKRILKFVRNPSNLEFLEGYLKELKYIYLTECNRGENTGTKTIADTRDALETTNPTRVQRKTRNLSDAITHVFGSSTFVAKLSVEFNVALVKRVNYFIGRELFENAGEFRTRDAKPSGCEMVYLSPHLIEECLLELVNKTRDDMKNSTVKWYEVVTRFFNEFLFIHPFRNGNGRTARVLLTALLITDFIVPVYILCPRSCSDVYLKCLRYSRMDDNTSLLCSLIIESVHHVLDDFVVTLDV
jgi:fido (protein-threonine AMPylation protein)